MIKPILLYLAFLSLSCNEPPKQNAAVKSVNKSLPSPAAPAFDSSIRTIHVLVALCDNKYQGILPVPAGIGNGQDANSNLYWGCDDGIRSYFKRSKNWTLVRRYHIDAQRLERVVFRHNRDNVFLIADAYDGRYIKQCTIDLLKSCSGQLKDTIKVEEKTLGIYGNAKLLSYIGHDGLMDFKLTDKYTNVDGKVRDVIIVACISKKYFSPHLATTKANPLVWTTGLMCPEAYTLHDALEEYLAGGPVENIRSAAARAYARNQHCSEKAARNLLVSGY